MKRNDVASLFYYMLNTWSEEECKIAFAQSNCGWRHIWDKWRTYCHINGRFGAIEEFFVNLSEENQDLLVERALELYDRKRRIK